VIFPQRFFRLGSCRESGERVADTFSLRTPAEKNGREGSSRSSPLSAPHRSRVRQDRPPNQDQRIIRFLWQRQPGESSNPPCYIPTDFLRKDRDRCEAYPTRVPSNVPTAERHHRICRITDKRKRFAAGRGIHPDEYRNSCSGKGYAAGPFLPIAHRRTGLTARWSKSAGIPKVHGQPRARFCESPVPGQGQILLLLSHQPLAR
jgi:hypothetical protein